MEYNLNEEQVDTIITALVAALNARDENAGMSEFFIDRLKDRIKRQEEEIEALKAKIKALRPKKTKKPVVAATAPAPAKRGRPKKEI